MAAIPVPVSVPPEGATDAAGWFPAVGLLLGLGGWLFLHLMLVAPLPHFSGLLIGALIVVGWGGATRLLHWDGLADVADGYWGSPDATRRLEIMSDSLVGAFGVTAVVLFAILEVAAVSAVILDGHQFPILVVPVFARLSATFAAWFGKPAKPTGLGRSVISRPTLAAIVPTVLVVVPTLLVIARVENWSRGWLGLLSLVALVVPHLIVAPFRRRDRRRDGGERHHHRDTLLRGVCAVVLTWRPPTSSSCATRRPTRTSAAGSSARASRPTPPRAADRPAGCPQDRAISPPDRVEFAAVASAVVARRAAMLGDIELRVDQRLIELDFGEAHGLTWEEIAEAGIPFNYRSEDEPVAPGGESRNQLETRVGAVVDEAIAIGGRHAMVCHAGVMRAVLAHALHLRGEQLWMFAIHNAQMTQLRVIDGHALLEEYVQG